MSIYADPDANAKGYPRRRVPPCQRGTPGQSGCRVACCGAICVYLTHENCPCPNWGNLTHTQRDDYNGTPAKHRIHQDSVKQEEP